MVARLALLLEMLGGARPLPRRYAASPVVSILTGLYWVGLLLLVLSFAGRAAKFIYIDF